ncbi:MAG: CRISPR-associated helicase Cas3' [Planctomycetes bacterium]|nr:CRISPR-associated helicase Cas3' [Planctomycetota bacterium]
MAEKQYLKYWGKANEVESGIEYHPLAYHCLDVAAVGYEFLKHNHEFKKHLSTLLKLDEINATASITFFLAIHDCGKFSEGFQNLIPELFKVLRGNTSNRGYAVHHDSLGFLLWQDKIWDYVWKENWFNLDYFENDFRRCRGIFDYWSAAFSGHHGLPPKTDRVEGSRICIQNHFSNEDEEAALLFIREIMELFIANTPPVHTAIEEMLLGIKQASWLLAGLAVLSDWLGSNNEYFQYCAEVMPLSEYWEKKALVQAELALLESGILSVSSSPFKGISHLFPSIRIPSGLQELTDSLDLYDTPQLFIIEDLTGSGKTEASLVLADRLMNKGLAGGIFLALPTMATSNAMYERISEVYKKFFAEPGSASLVLAHSARNLSEAFKRSILFTDGKKEMKNDLSFYSEEGSAQCTYWLADNRKKAFLAHVGVGTIDQALLAILPSKHQSLRLLGLSRKVLIIDEVHAYDSYMNMLLRNLIRFHASLGGSAILLSATLPFNTRSDLIKSFYKGTGDDGENPSCLDYPLLTQVSRHAIFENPVEARNDLRRRINVEFLPDFDTAAEQILEMSSRQKCICWLRNTVYDACLAYEHLCGLLPEDSILLFHARFAMGDRLEIEDKVLKVFGKTGGSKERKGKVLIATQVVEQSLDLDFDEIITDLAPIDLLIQRAGRLHRHARDIEGNLYLEGDYMDQRGVPCLRVFSPPVIEDPDEDWYKKVFPKASFVYPNHGRLWLTAKLLHEKAGWVQPDDARSLIEGVYGDEGPAIPDKLVVLEDKAWAESMAARSLARVNHLDFENGYFPTPGQWLEDTQTPTRLGQISTAVRLAKWDGQKLTPWAEAEANAWSLSEVSVTRKIKSEYEGKDELSLAVRKAKQLMPDKGKWSVVLPLVEKGDGLWQGKLRDESGDFLDVEYSKKKGFHFCEKGGGDDP